MSTLASQLSGLLSSYLYEIASYRDYANDGLSHHARIQDTARLIRAKLFCLEAGYNSIDQDSLDRLGIALRHSSDTEGKFYNRPLAEEILVVLEAIGEGPEADMIERAMLLMTQPLRARAWAVVQVIRKRIASGSPARILLRPAELAPDDILLRPAGGGESRIEDLLRPAETVEADRV